MKFRVATSFATLALTLVPSLNAQTTLETPGGSSMGSWTTNYPSIYGQTFVAPTTDNVLDSFSFWLKSSSATTNLNYTAHVFAYDVLLGRPVGTALFESALTNYSATSAEGFRQVTTSTGGIDLAAGEMYYAYLRTGPGSGTGNVVFENMYGNPYAGGTFVWSHDDAASYTTYADDDLRVQLQFSSPPTTVTPEPLSIMLLGAGLAGVAAARRRRQNTSAA